MASKRITTHELGYFCGEKCTHYLYEDIYKDGSITFRIMFERDNDDTGEILIYANCDVEETMKMWFSLKNCTIINNDKE